MIKIGFVKTQISGDRREITITRRDRPVYVTALAVTALAAIGGWLAWQWGPLEPFTAIVGAFTATVGVLFILEVCLTSLMIRRARQALDEASSLLDGQRDE